jgi:hypothetical protein
MNEQPHDVSMTGNLTVELDLLVLAMVTPMPRLNSIYHIRLYETFAVMIREFS